MSDASLPACEAQDLNAPCLHHAVFMAHPDAVLLVEASGAIVMANSAASSLLGYTLDELSRLNVDALVPGAAHDRHAGFRQSYGQQPRVRAMGSDMDLRARRKDGAEVMVEIALSPLPGFARPMVLASIRAIGAYPRVKQALLQARYSESLARLGRQVVDAGPFQTVLDLVPRMGAQALQVEVVTVYLLDEDHQTLRVASCVGEPPERQTGSTFPYDTAQPAVRVLLQGHKVVVDDYRSDAVYTVDEAYLRAGLVSAAAVPIADRGNMIGVLVARARSAARFGEDEVHYLESLANFLATCLQRARSEAALNHAQRLETVGQLSGGVAHDFNNLLTVIQGNLEVLEGLPVVARDNYSRQLIEAAARAARSGAELTNKLLAFSRRQLLQPTVVETAPMLRALANMLRRALDLQIHIEVRAEAACPRVQADVSQLEAALLSVAINARDAMPHGGMLCFQAQACDRLPLGVRSQLEGNQMADAFVVIAVSDTGCGMSPEVKERAFEPFFTTKPSGRGTGLGLSTVFGFVKQSHGAVTIESCLGHGTTVRLYLPQAPERPVLADVGAPPDQVLPARLKIMVVEDDPEVRAVTQTFLAQAGCEVLGFSNGEQVMAQLDSLGQIDLLLTDIALGSGMRGLELAGLMQKTLPGMAVILMSGFSSDLLAADHDCPPSWELLRKPYSRDELAQVIASALNLRATTACLAEARPPLSSAPQAPAPDSPAQNAPAH